MVLFPQNSIKEKKSENNYKMSFRQNDIKEIMLI